jgi:hypothetical protein
MKQGLDASKESRMCRLLRIERLETGMDQMAQFNLEFGIRDVPALVSGKACLSIGF